MKSLYKFYKLDEKFTPDAVDIKGWEIIEIPNTSAKVKKMKAKNAKLLKDYIDVKKIQKYMDANRKMFAPAAKAEQYLAFSNLHTEPTVLVATNDGYAVFNKEGEFKEYQAKSFYPRTFKYKDA